MKSGQSGPQGSMKVDKEGSGVMKELKVRGSASLCYFVAFH